MWQSCFRVRMFSSSGTETTFRSVRFSRSGVVNSGGENLIRFRAFSCVVRRFGNWVVTDAIRYVSREV